MCDAKETDAVKKLMEYDPYLDKNLSEERLSEIKDDAEANIIFARQDYKIKDGVSLQMDSNKCYLYISANEEFLSKADAKLKKNIPGISRADSETERKVIEAVDKETSESEQGIGFIFGG